MRSPFPFPKVVLEVEGLFSEIGGAESGAEGVVRFGEQAHAGQIGISGRVAAEEFTERSLLGLLPGVAGYLFEIGGDRSAGGQGQKHRAGQERFEIVLSCHAAKVARGMEDKCYPAPMIITIKRCFF